jgi:hypothetical protein
MAQPKNMGQLIALIEDEIVTIEEIRKMETGVTKEWEDADLRNVSELISMAALRAGVTENIADQIGDLSHQFRNVETRMVSINDELAILLIELGSTLHIVQAIRHKVQRARDSSEFTV